MIGKHSMKVLLLDTEYPVFSAIEPLLQAEFGGCAFLHLEEV